MLSMGKIFQLGRSIGVVLMMINTPKILKSMKMILKIWMM